MSGKKRRPITAHFQICVLWTLRYFVRDSRKDQKGLMKGVLLKQTNQLTQTSSYQRIPSQSHSAFCSVTMFHPTIASPKDTFINKWHLIQHLQREIYKKPTLIYYFSFLQSKTLWSCKHVSYSTVSLYVSFGFSTL